MTTTPESSTDPFDVAAAIAAGCTVIRSSTVSEGRRETTVDGPAGRWIIDHDQRLWSAFHVRSATDPTRYFVTRDGGVALQAACERAGTQV